MPSFHFSLLTHMHGPDLLLLLFLLLPFCHSASAVAPVTTALPRLSSSCCDLKSLVIICPCLCPLAFPFRGRNTQQGNAKKMPTASERGIISRICDAMRLRRKVNPTPAKSPRQDL
ncbi:hypothetical protein WR25_19400 [Diploscapter pachys]|uniref:Secreted protein n=1 Tax=Diploscapter pachys TaxID=2018661 RepID=A0A2A2K985_9BILA|nr:hypothetical protein WR25_19400 [Diploscapter pachys]